MKIYQVSEPRSAYWKGYVSYTYHYQRTFREDVQFLDFLITKMNRTTGDK